jgi:outer membrane lipoprotein carrier protein
MKKATLLFITFLFASSLSVWAQTNTATKDPKKILQSVSQKISDLKSLKANFALHLMAANGKTTQSQKGSFQMKGTKYRVTLADQEIICDNKVVWTFLKSINEVQISAYNPSEQTISPAKLFTDFYDKEYNSRYAGSRTVNGKKCDIIELIPKQQQVQFSKIELAVDNTYTIVGGNVYEKNGNHYRYEISNFTPNATIAEETFTFDANKHPGVEVIDLR